MPRFFYITRDNQGRKSSGTEEGFSQDEIVSRLQARGLFVVNVISEFKDGPGGSKLDAKTGKGQFKHYRVTSDDLVLFCRQVATLLGAGVTILKSLEIISQQVPSRKFFAVLKKLQKDMEAGLSLHEAMSRHSAVFSELWVNLVESGEASGNLAMVLNRLATYLERNAAFKKKIISALIYPAILMFAGFGALLFLTIKIIPTFAELFKGFNVKLPFLTQVLVDISYFTRTNLLYFVIITAVVVFLIRRYVRTREGRKQYEKLKFSLPTFGDFFRSLVIERFSSEMSTLVESGVPILYSLEIAEHSVGNLTMANIIHTIKEDVRSGKSLSQPLSRSGFFEPMVVQMVAIGEEIGELPQMFKKINAFYQDYVETFLTRFTAMFEPIMLIFMGVVIGIMVIGMFLPIFQISQISGG
ncbi:MAG: type II secretion system F family protein [Candidatus Omnitrophica bacterium]|jgi:type IV pilus assembly protein PilC|nr:type II secretion system F family protein [Candidatus Omnitrophota bacterium]